MPALKSAWQLVVAGANPFSLVLVYDLSTLKPSRRCSWFNMVWIKKGWGVGFLIDYCMSCRVWPTTVSRRDWSYFSYCWRYCSQRCCSILVMIRLDLELVWEKKGGKFRFWLNLVLAIRQGMGLWVTDVNNICISYSSGYPLPDYGWI